MALVLAEKLLGQSLNAWEAELALCQKKYTINNAWSLFLQSRLLRVDVRTIPKHQPKVRGNLKCGPRCQCILFPPFLASHWLPAVCGAQSRLSQSLMPRLASSGERFLPRPSVAASSESRCFVRT